MTRDEMLKSESQRETVTLESGSKFFGKVFLYLGIALAITAIVSTLVGFGLQATIFENSDVYSDAVFTALFLAVILYIPTLIWARISATRNGKTMYAAYFTYSAVMGVLLSFLTAFIPFYDLAVSFGLTCLSFGFMALIAWKSKKDLSPLALAGSGLMFGCLFLMLFNFILQSDSLSWAISFAILIGTILLTIFDLNNVKKIAEEGNAGNNIALMFALNLYVDFIYIFIRILSVVISLRRD